MYIPKCSNSICYINTVERDCSEGSYLRLHAAQKILELPFFFSFFSFSLSLFSGRLP